ncbi:MAG: pyridoxal-phosphate dependent enzyme [Muribaculaceae bacterium]|nr:pyridoxal-phosphate dependent enzyme [Muribaculaceae bacterium]
MKFVSTCNPGIELSLSEAVSACIAPDGGLLLPARIPRLPLAFFNNISELSLREIAYVVASSFFADDIPPQALKRIVDRAFASGIPMSAPSGPHAPRILELFHGPTLSVKDFGAIFMAGILEELQQRGSGPRHRKILLASSGNSAIAIGSAFRNIKDVDLYVVSPHGSLKRRRHLVLSSFGPGIHILEAAGLIDDCNAMVREFISQSRADGDICICGANSVNVARLIPPVVFFFHAYALLCGELGPEKAAQAAYVVPCGNLTLLTAAVIARRMGLPMGRIIAASSATDALGRFMRGDSESNARSELAPAMNSRSPLNLPRLLSLCGGREGMASELEFASVSDSRITETVCRMRSDFAYSLSPHSAVAWSVASDMASDGIPVVALATAHPAVDIDIFTKITGAPVELPHQLTRLMNTRLSPVEHIAPTAPALRKAVKPLKY